LVLIKEIIEQILPEQH